MEALLEASNYWGVASLQEQCEEGLILSLNPTNLVDRSTHHKAIEVSAFMAIVRSELSQGLRCLVQLNRQQKF
jgi:hypothetical protein